MVKTHIMCRSPRSRLPNHAPPPRRRNRNLQRYKDVHGHRSCVPRRPPGGSGCRDLRYRVPVLHVVLRHRHRGRRARHHIAVQECSSLVYGIRYTVYIYIYLYVYVYL